MRDFVRRALPSQLFVAATIVAASFVGHAPWPVLVALGIILEVGALLGLAFNALLRRKPQANATDDLPLSRRR